MIKEFSVGSGGGGEKFSIAIETGVGGGSLTVCRGETIVAEWTGKSGVSRSEELLRTISDLTKKHGVGKKDLEKILISRGPGSFTGLRIGLATAIGLRDGWGVECVGVPLLEAMTALAEPTGDKIIVAVSFGRAEVCWQEYGAEKEKEEKEEKVEKNEEKNEENEDDGKDEKSSEDANGEKTERDGRVGEFHRAFRDERFSIPRSSALPEFTTLIETTNDCSIIADRKLFNALENQNKEIASRLTDAGENLSRLFFQYAKINKNASDKISIIYTV